MRKLITLIALTCTFGASAQIEGGTMVAGGNASFNHYMNRSLDIQQSSAVISPQFGLAFADNFIAGAYFSFSSFSDVSSWGVGPFVRYYYKNLYAQLGYGYNKTESFQQSVGDLSIGYAIFFNDYVALEPALYYNQYFGNNGGSDLGFKVGFQVYFNR